jgi:hypothetical protein
MRIELLYFDGCPNWMLTEQRIAEALAIRGLADVDVELRRVETVERAEELGFLGSPSIRIGGADPFATGREPVGLSCRLYSTPGGLSGSPTTEQLLEVLS